MKRIICLLAAFAVAASLAVVSSAQAFNPADGCRISFQVKKADSSLVVHDGIISDGEYEEIEINRDPDTTDVMFSWDGDETLYDKCEEFLQNVHFYMSWDEVHGLNVAGRATLLETPENLCEQPAEDRMVTNFGTFPGDEFLFQFGMMFRQYTKDGDENLYRGISVNTANGTQLYGHYGTHGYKGVLSQTSGNDYFVAVSGNTVTYEISFPVDCAFPASDIENGLPKDNASFDFDMSLTGGSVGLFHEDYNTYAISIGDGGYITSPGFIPDYASAKAVISHENVAYGGTDTGSGEGTGDTGEGTVELTGAATEPQLVTQVVTDERGESQVIIVDPEGDTRVVETDANGEVVVPGAGDADGGQATNATGNGGNTAPGARTFDPVIIAGAAAVIGSAGIILSKKKRR